jgi:hypothetical protein
MTKHNLLRKVRLYKMGTLKEDVKRKFQHYLLSGTFKATDDLSKASKV